MDAARLSAGHRMGMLSGSSGGRRWRRQFGAAGVAGSGARCGGGRLVQPPSSASRMSAARCLKARPGHGCARPVPRPDHGRPSHTADSVIAGDHVEIVETYPIAHATLQWRASSTQGVASGSFESTCTPRAHTAPRVSPRATEPDSGRSAASAYCASASTGSP